MMTISIGKADASCVDKVTLTSGMVNAVQVTFAFSSEWEGFDKIAVFSNGSTSIDISLENEDRCHIPHEVLAEAGREVTCGVYGSKDGVALPTVKCSLGKVVDGADPSGEESAEPTPSILVDHENRISELEKGSGGKEHTHDVPKCVTEEISLLDVTTSSKPDSSTITTNTLAVNSSTDFNIDFQGEADIVLMANVPVNGLQLYIDGVLISHNLPSDAFEWKGIINEGILIRLRSSSSVTFQRFLATRYTNGFMTWEQANKLANTPTAEDVENLIHEAFGIVAEVFDEVHEYAESLGGDEA